jgi:hypothetical protein
MIRGDHLRDAQHHDPCYTSDSDLQPDPNLMIPAQARSRQPDQRPHRSFIEPHLRLCARSRRIAMALMPLPVPSGAPLHTQEVIAS